MARPLSLRSDAGIWLDLALISQHRQEKWRKDWQKIDRLDLRPRNEAFKGREEPREYADASLHSPVLIALKVFSLSLSADR